MLGGNQLPGTPPFRAALLNFASIGETDYLHAGHAIHNIFECVLMRLFVAFNNSLIGTRHKPLVVE